MIEGCRYREQITLHFGDSYHHRFRTKDSLTYYKVTVVIGVHTVRLDTILNHKGVRVIRRDPMFTSVFSVPKCTYRHCIVVNV